MACTDAMTLNAEAVIGLMVLFVSLLPAAFAVLQCLSRQKALGVSPTTSRRLTTRYCYGPNGDGKIVVRTILPV